MPTPDEILRERARKARIPIGQTDDVQPAVSASAPQAQPTLVEQFMQTGQNTMNSINNAYADLAKQNEAILAEQQRVNAEREKSFAQMMSEQRNAYEQRMVENERDLQATKRAARYTGATELASAIVNLVGVAGLGAENQSYKTYSVDWMKRMDNQKEVNRNYRDAMRDKMNSLQLQLDNLKQGNLSSVLNLRYNAAKENAQGRIAAAQQAEKNAQGAITLQHQLEREKVDDNFKQQQLNNQRYATGVSERARIADDERQAAAAGLVRNPDGTYTYNKDLDPKVTQAREREAAKISAKQSKAGYGSSANNLLRLSISDDNGGGETYVIEPKSLAATIYANSPSVTDKKSVRKNMSSKVDTDLGVPPVELSRSEQRTLMQVANGTLKGQEATIALTPILKSHPELREPVKHSSVNYETWATSNGYTVPDFTERAVTTDFSDEPQAAPTASTIKFPGDEEDKNKKKSSGIQMP